MAGFIKYMRSEAAQQLLSKPLANHLLSVIASRARYHSDPINGLQVGQCFMGDFTTIGLTRQQYRSNLQLLEKARIITTKTTNKGTIVTLVNSDIYDINSDEQPSSQPTSNQQATIQQPSNNHPTTTNKERKKERRKEGKNDKELMFETFWSAYPGPRAKTKREDSLKTWMKIDPQIYQTIIDHVTERPSSDPKWIENDGEFIPGPAPFLKGKRWQDSWKSDHLQRHSETTRHNIQVMQETKLL